MTEERSDKWFDWFLKLMVILLLTTLPSAVIASLFLLLSWVPPYISNPTILLAVICFFTGSLFLIGSKDLKKWYLYLLLAGFIVGVGGVGAAPTYAMGDLNTMEFAIYDVPVEEQLTYNKPSVTPHS